FIAPGTALGPMRRLAIRLALSRLVFYDHNLRAIGRRRLPLWLLRQASGTIRQQLAEGGRTRKWLRRLTRPAEAEIPVRARLAQLRGRMAARNNTRRADFPGPMPHQPLSSGVSVVIPTRDGRDLLAALLPALLSQVATGEVLIVDNGSSDGTRAWLAEHYPTVRVIESTTPLSFARAVNAGIAEARFSRLLMLNNDMVPEPGFVAALEAAFASVPGLYCATAQIFFPSGMRREETGKAVWRQDAPLDFPVRCDDPLPGEDLTWVLYGSGGCSLFDTAMLCELGGVSTLYDPAYVEDMDFGYRAWKRGWPTVFVAGAKVEHRHRATTSRFYSPADLELFVERNYLRFLETAISAPDLFARLWTEGIRRLQLRNDLRTLREVPLIGAR
ncbi:MAG: glycosyltransferase, partial [Acidobacteriia bacterium]|nr:glycosyltransferase [Terriglobia bacterium]